MILAIAMVVGAANLVPVAAQAVRRDTTAASAGAPVVQTETAASTPPVAPTSTVAPTTVPPAPPVEPVATVPPTTAPAPPPPPPPAPTGPRGLPAFLAGVPHAEEIDWVLRPGSHACMGSEGAAWWSAGDTITFQGGRLIAETASNQVCVSLGAANVHDVALHEAAHWWQAHVIGVVRIYDDFGSGYPINPQADYAVFSRNVLETMADCAARSWGASWIHYGCPASLAHAYGL